MEIILIFLSIVIIALLVFMISLISRKFTQKHGLPRYCGHDKKR